MVSRIRCIIANWYMNCIAAGKKLLKEQEGQGTTEYAILVGVLVVIAIIAILAFRGRIQELWNTIAESINGL